MIRFELVREKKKRKKDTHTHARARRKNNSGMFCLAKYRKIEK